MYAWPVSSRICQASGQWSIMESKTRWKYTKIYCKEMRCPNPDRFDNGEYFPRGPYKVGDNITFVCSDGYIPRGSMERTCKSNAKWSGETAVCDDGAGHCPDPGEPPGARKTGLRYDVDERVSYTCALGLDLVGSAKRTCLESRRWSGTEVSCQYPYAFDLPEDVGQQFAGSLSGLLNTYEKKAAVGRTVKIKKDGILNVYLLLDASESVGENNFDISKKSIEDLVNRLGSFDMIVQFGIMSYATETKVIINVHDKDSSDVDYVLEEIENKLIYNEHRNKQGTNIKGALTSVYNMMAFQKGQYKEDEWNSIQHVIILLTDGKSNMGGRPVDMINRIREFLDIKPTREDYLDIYAFGIGEEVDRSELNDIASKKDNEKHIFTLEDSEKIKAVFSEITKIENYGEMCGLNDESSSDRKLHHPWNVLINVSKENAGGTSPCFGSLISSQWILTAAHCFKGHTMDQYTFEIGSATYKAELRIIHKCYNIIRKANRGIKEDYDYDVALVKLTEKVEFSSSARPICLPCTEMANRAMKKPKTATCNDHRQHLLSSVSSIPAGFLAKSKDKKELEELKVEIQHNNAREDCISTIKKWDKFHNITNLQDMVSPRHLCVNGEMSCKGESGGSLFVDIRDRKRFFQVGILSFGIYNPCEKKTVRKPSSNARDFYVNVLEVLPFLRKHLEGELQFLPGIPDLEEIVCPA
ncbi:PREDICTED: complement C2-like [Nanorana parkeri]|uniref:complement C2-like n=1 Tax=Nanorana parkeri TaxID=125878 RepID=UPI000854C0C5|nr:PREDICTED: complement C2-like [Nanorana parkeri]